MGLIYFIIFLILVLLILAVLIFTKALSIKLYLDTNKDDANICFTWLYPFFKAEVFLEGTKPVFKVYIFKAKIFTKILKSKNIKAKKRKLNGVKLIKSANTDDINVITSYGFKDPYVTGLACGVFGIFSNFIKPDAIKQFPDFMANEDYIHIDASAKVNVGTTLLNLTSKKS